MARFVEIGKYGEMLNVEQVVSIYPIVTYPNKKLDEYTVHMSSGNDYNVTYDEFLEITGQREHQSSDKKYTVKVLKDDIATLDSRYLSVNYQTNRVAFSDEYEVEGWRTSFTEKEIEELKQRDDIAIDWDKVELEEVEDD